MASYRKETDSIGEIEVSEEVYWGAQTQRSLNNFKIADQKMPREIIKALALLKRCAALVNSKIATYTYELVGTLLNDQVVVVEIVLVK
jgi:fumarate hydratase class II